MNSQFIKSFTPHFGTTEKDLFSFKELETLLNLRPYVSDKRFNPNGEDIKEFWHTPSWSSDKTTWPVSNIRNVIKDRTVYLTDSSRANKRINDFCKELEHLVNLPVDCHLYFSLKKDTKNLGKHFDYAHNIIVGCIGSVKVDIFVEDDKMISKELSNGDYAFIPKLIDHQVTPLTDRRLTCSFPMSVNQYKVFDDRDWLEL